jgi:hypothetical protein
MQGGSKNPSIEVCTVENKTKKKLEICTGRLSMGGVLFQLVDQIRLHVIEADKRQELKSFLVKEDKDYFIKESQNASILLRFGYSIIEGDAKKMLSLILVRYARSFKVGPDGLVERIYEEPNRKSLDLDLSKMQAKGTLNKILLRVTVEGESLEKSKIEALPVYEKEANLMPIAH